MATAQATHVKTPDPAALRPVPGVFTTRQQMSCAACGREVALLEARHLIDGAAFHTVCVPSGSRR
jgi:hypothetical protein